MRRVLHVGSGPATINSMPRGFQDGTWSEVRLDIEPAVQPDIIGTITDMSAVESSTFDAVYSSHNIEHVYSHEVVVALKEFKRALNDDGFAVITCPDIQEVAKHVAANRLTEPLYIAPAGPITPLDIMFGHIRAVKRGEHYMAHRTAFTLDRLISCLNEAGFVSVGGFQDKNAFSLWVLATKSRRDQSEMLTMMRRFLK